MKRNIIYLAILVVGAGIAGYFMMQDAGSSTTISEKDADFAYTNPSEIQRIELTHSNGQMSVLEKQEDHWTVNSEYIARPGAIKLLLNTIGRIQVMSPVADAAHNNVINSMLSESVKVALYSDKDKADMAYLVGRSNPEVTGTYMIMERKGKMADRAFVTYIPGQPGYLTPRFITDPEEWRSMTIMSYMPEEIQQVVVDYPRNPQASFSLGITKEGNITVDPKVESARISSKLDDFALHNFIKAFEAGNIEAYENQFEFKDSITAVPPYATIQVTNWEDQTQVVEVYYMPINKRSKMQFTELGIPLNYDVDRYFVRFNEGRDFGILQYYNFGKFFMKYPQFFTSSEGVEPLAQ